MKNFQVELRRDCSQVICVSVQAETAADAECIAQEMIDDPDLDLEWGPEAVSEEFSVESVLEEEDE